MLQAKPPPHSLLPPDAIAQLQKAAQTPNTASDPLARVKAIQQATERIKTQYPTHFIQEKYHHENYAN